MADSHRVHIRRDGLSACQRQRRRRGGEASHQTPPPGVLLAGATVRADPVRARVWRHMLIYSLLGSKENGSNRWIVDAAKARGIDLGRDVRACPMGSTDSAQMLLGGGEDGYMERIAAAEQTEGRDEIFREVCSSHRVNTRLTCQICFRSDHVCSVPGVPPFREFKHGAQLISTDMYEYWSAKQNFPKAVQEGMMANIAGRPAITPAVEAWVSFFPSDVVEPQCVNAAGEDPFIGEGGKKPIFLVGPCEATAQRIDEEVKVFLDKHAVRSVVLVSFGTLVDAGTGADVLFEELAEARTPFIFATGGQQSSLPSRAKGLIHAAVIDGRAVAPDWVSQAAVLRHPVGLFRGIRIRC